MVACPTMDKIDLLFATSLFGMNRCAEMNFQFQSNSLVWEARNSLAKKAVDGGYDRILWIDSDMKFDKTLAETLSNDLDEGRDFVGTCCFKRSLPTQPLICKTLDWWMDEKGIPHSHADLYLDYPKDQVFEVAGIGLGALMMKTELFGKVTEAFGVLPFTPMPMMSEDYSLCWRLTKLGIPLYCDSRIKIQHIGQYMYGEEDWLKQNTVCDVWFTQDDLNEGK